MYGSFPVKGAHDFPFSFGRVPSIFKRKLAEQLFLYATHVDDHIPPTFLGQWYFANKN